MENGRSRLQKAHEDVEEVKVIMLDNLDKAEERTGKLGELENRADNLLEKSKTFSKTSTKVKNQKRWENTKWKVIMAVVGVIVIVSVIGILVYSLSGSGTDDSSSRENRVSSSTVEPHD